MAETPTILVIDDEESYVVALTRALGQEGFNVVSALDGREGLEAFERSAPDVVLLDVMLPGLSGLDVCREIRRRSQVPIVMCSAKGGEVDVVVGLEIGADDYVVKPFRIRELIARIRAAMRRREALVPVIVEDLDGDIWEYNGLKVDMARRELSLHGSPVALPRKEFELLAILMANAGRAMPRHSLIKSVWGNDYVGDTKTLDVHIKRLRRKIEPDPSEPARLLTVRGYGYKFDAGEAKVNGYSVVAPD
jgi:two-component system response regulator RegX3